MDSNVTFKVINFGCPVNQYEAEALVSAMEKAGFVKTAGKAGIYIVNSCVVTGAAAAEARRVLRKTKKENPQALTVMAGCYPQVYHREIKEQLPEADIIIGTTGRAELPRLIKKKLDEGWGGQDNLVREHNGDEIFENMPIETSYSRTRPVVKIQEGCDEFCTYCIVARARGRPRSMSPERVVRQVKHFVDQGYREIILAGNHLGIYGRDIPGWDLVRILKTLEDIPGDFRIRLNYVEPMDVHEELLDVMTGSERICHHLYLPLQSGADRILKKMGRRYTASDYARIVLRARKLMPDLSVFTDIIVGFPGETGADHRATVDLVESIELTRLHVFPYSPRPGTPAVKYGDPVRPDIKKQRVEELRALDEKLAGNFHARMVGTSLDVLPESLVEFEGRTFGDGLSGNNVRVRFPFADNTLSGRIVWVKVDKAYDWGVTGKIL